MKTQQSTNTQIKGRGRMTHKKQKKKKKRKMRERGGNTSEKLHPSPPKPENYIQKKENEIKERGYTSEKHHPSPPKPIHELPRQASFSPHKNKGEEREERQQQQQQQNGEKERITYKKRKMRERNEGTQVKSAIHRHPSQSMNAHAKPASAHTARNMKDWKRMSMLLRFGGGTSSMSSVTAMCDPPSPNPIHPV
jgi:hypothetical protein